MNHGSFGRTLLPVKRINTTHIRYLHRKRQHQFAQGGMRNMEVANYPRNRMPSLPLGSLALPFIPSIRFHVASSQKALFPVARNLRLTFLVFAKPANIPLRPYCEFAYAMSGTINKWIQVSRQTFSGHRWGNSLAGRTGSCSCL